MTLPAETFGRVLEKYMADARSFFWDAAMALAVNGISGDYVEFGSVGGKSLALAHEALSAMDAPRRLWAFDSFEGLPVATDPRDVHPQWGPGGSGADGASTAADAVRDHDRTLAAFHRACSELGVPRDAYTVVDGFFEDTLPALGTDGAPSDIALAYIDCNTYSSTVTVLDFLRPRLKHGMIVGVDDYNCWSPAHVSGERTALHEFHQEHPEWRFRRYKDIHWAGVSFVVERADLLT